MSAWRILVIVIVGAIVAAAAFAVYLLSGLNDAPPSKLGGIENFIPAREVLPAPATMFLDENGAKLNLERFRGKVVVLNLWATWCTPCVAEMPMLDAFQRDHAAQGWQVVGLAVDNPEPVRDFVAKRQIGFAIGLVGFAGADLARDFGNTSGSLPFSVVFGRDGQPKHQKLGALKPEDLASWVKSVE